MVEKVFEDLEPYLYWRFPTRWLTLLDVSQSVRLYDTVDSTYSNVP